MSQLRATVLRKIRPASKIVPMRLGLPTHHASSRLAAPRRFARIAAVILAGLLSCGRGIAAAENRAPARPTADRITSSVPIFDQLLLFGIPRGWRPAYEDAAAGKYILEFVPDDQTVKAWREMITVQGFRDAGLNEKLSPERFLGLVARRMRDLCGAETVSIRLGDRVVDTFRAHAAIIGCGALPSSHPTGVKRGQGEVAYYLAIQGRRDLYVFQRAIRGAAFDPANPPINADNVSQLMRHVEPIRLCDRALTPEQCWERKAGQASGPIEAGAAR